MSERAREHGAPPPRPRLQNKIPSRPMRMRNEPLGSGDVAASAGAHCRGAARGVPILGALRHGLTPALCSPEKEAACAPQPPSGRSLPSTHWSPPAGEPGEGALRRGASVTCGPPNTPHARLLTPSRVLRSPLPRLPALFVLPSGPSSARRRPSRAQRTPCPSPARCRHLTPPHCVPWDAARPGSAPLVLGAPRP